MERYKAKATYSRGKNVGSRPGLRKGWSAGEVWSCNMPVSKQSCGAVVVVWWHGQILMYFLKNYYELHLSNWRVKFYTKIITRSKLEFAHMTEILRSLENISGCRQLVLCLLIFRKLNLKISHFFMTYNR